MCGGGVPALERFDSPLQTLDGPRFEQESAPHSELDLCESAPQVGERTAVHEAQLYSDLRAGEDTVQGKARGPILLVDEVHTAALPRHDPALAIGAVFDE